MSCLGRAAAGRLSQTALHDLQDYLLKRIAHLPLESQATFSGNCCRRGGLFPYQPAVYPRGHIAFSKFEQSVRWTLNAPAPTIQNMRVDHRSADITVTEQFLYGSDIVAIFEQMRSERMT